MSDMINEDEATLFLADLLNGIHQADSRHEKHCFLERVPVKEMGSMPI